MKRLLALTAVLSLGAIFSSAPPATSQGTATVTRGFTERVTATTTPRRDRTRPYRFTTTGRIVPPGRFCAPGVPPTPGPGNCIPITCPPGLADLRYCTIPPAAAICSGVVNVRFQKRGTTISSRNVRVRPNCTFRSRVTFSSRLRLRRGVFTVRARFQGNPVLQPKNSPTRRVRAG